MPPQSQSSRFVVAVCITMALALLSAALYVVWLPDFIFGTAPELARVRAGSDLYILRQEPTNDFYRTSVEIHRGTSVTTRVLDGDDSKLWYAIPSVTLHTVSFSTNDGVYQMPIPYD